MKCGKMRIVQTLFIGAYFSMFSKCFNGLSRRFPGFYMMLDWFYGSIKRVFSGNKRNKA